MIERIMKRVDAGDAIAIHRIGCYYKYGRNRYPQDYNKALEHWHRSGELGCVEAFGSIGRAYINGDGVDFNKGKAEHYWELAAIGGDLVARHTLGIVEEQKGNVDRALKHHMIAVRDGDAPSLKNVKELYSKGHATKEDYTKALQLYQTYLGEIKSAQRDKAAADDGSYRFYENYRYY